MALSGFFMRVEVAALAAVLSLGFAASRAQGAGEKPVAGEICATRAEAPEAAGALPESSAEASAEAPSGTEEAEAAGAPRSFTLIIHHTELEQVEFETRAGDELIFRNTGDIAHNLYLTYEDGTVETLHTQPPGTEKRTILKASGRVLVRCWIHPIIRLELDVAAAE
ncbi:hypothetical protein [Neomegalonema sp.]|uniref:hypothetical protein n=1 Tax=Neomegalonema sp. TaxID=2039713 RepID=UPI0026054E11|nr:hypothetical protein [Neomegalonema sp.]MDD2867339.1 hypothetical protein [Neomegalonema sp.]